MTRQLTIQGRRSGTRVGPNGLVLAALRSPVGRLFRARVCALRFAGRSTGETITLPVGYTRTANQIVILAGHGATKTWWRNFRAPRQVQVWLDGRWRGGTGTALLTGHPDRTAALATYRSAHPRVPVDTDDPLVLAILDAEPPPTSRQGSLWLPWFGSVTLGECLGFAAPAIVGAATAGGAAAVSTPLLLLAGAVEGATLGWFQVRVLRRALPSLSTARWTVATAGAASLAWAVGLAPSTIGADLGTWSPAILVPVAGIGGLVLLLSIGTAQWLVLRTQVRRAGHWIWITALAWAVAIGLFMAVATPLWQPGQSGITIALIGALGGLVMAATVAAVTGVLLPHILDFRDQAGQDHARRDGADCPRTEFPDRRQEPRP